MSLIPNPKSQIPNLPHQLSVIILAGGRSSRMGRDKAVIEVGGVPLIRRMYDAVARCHEPDHPDQILIHADAAQLCQRIYVITPWAERYQSILPVTCNFIPEQQPDRGPLIAFTQGLIAITSTWVLLLACDLPNLSTPIIQSWIDGLPSVSPLSIAYLPKHSHGWEPLCGFYRQICHHSLRAYSNAGGKSFQGWLKMNVVTELAVVDPIWLVNCNTPDDLAAIVADR